MTLPAHRGRMGQSSVVLGMTECQRGLRRTTYRQAAISPTALSHFSLDLHETQDWAVGRLGRHLPAPHGDAAVMRSSKNKMFSEDWPGVTRVFVCMLPLSKRPLFLFKNNSQRQCGNSLYVRRANF